MNRQIYVTCGLAGSGKSTYLRETPSNNDLILRRDPFAKIHGYNGLPWQAFVTSEISRYPNKTVWIDQATVDVTKGSIESLKRLLFGVNWLLTDEITLLAFHTPIEVCRERVRMREHGYINEGLQYLYADNCPDNPLITEEQVKSLVFGNKISWKAITQ